MLKIKSNISLNYCYFLSIWRYGSTGKSNKCTETVLSSTLEIEQMVEEAQRQSNNLKEGADSISEISNDLEEKMGFFKVR